MKDKNKKEQAPATVQVNMRFTPDERKLLDQVSRKNQSTQVGSVVDGLHLLYKSLSNKGGKK